MRHTFLVLAASTFLALLAGCACNNNCCNNQSGKAAGVVPPTASKPQQAGPGGAVSYPYYTIRGPRDFLETHPQSIGP